MDQFVILHFALYRLLYVSEYSEVHHQIIAFLSDDVPGLAGGLFCLSERRLQGQNHGIVRVITLSVQLGGQRSLDTPNRIRQLDRERLQF